MCRPAGWSGAPVRRVTRVSTVSSAPWDTAGPSGSSDPSAHVKSATVMDTATPATLILVRLGTLGILGLLTAVPPPSLTLGTLGGDGLMVTGTLFGLFQVLDRILGLFLTGFLRF